MMPCKSIMRPTLMPERSTVSKCPSSIRMPAQVWHRLSDGGCSPNDNTQGQNTVQLQDNASSPFKVQLSVNAVLPFLFCHAQMVRIAHWATMAMRQSRRRE